MSAVETAWPGISFRTVGISDPRFERDDLRKVTVKSAALGQRADLTVHATPAARSAADVPLVILLHGVYGSHWAWTEKGGAHLTAARLEAAGEIPPVVLAMPSDGLWGDGSAYLRHRIQDFERWIGWEVPAATAQAVPNVTPKSRVCIAGLSMGGFGALRLGARFPERFAAVSGHSSITHFDQMSLFVEERLGSYTALAEDRSVFDVMLRHRDRLSPTRFDCGTTDPLIEHNRELHRALEAAGIAHHYEEFPGGHEWPYWETHLADSLRFFSRVLKSTP
jgi:S-formylglutathione hydrolase FrmB